MRKSKINTCQCGCYEEFVSDRFRRFIRGHCNKKRFCKHGHDKYAPHGSYIRKFRSKNGEIKFYVACAVCLREVEKIIAKRWYWTKGRAMRGHKKVYKKAI